MVWLIYGEDGKRHSKPFTSTEGAAKFVLRHKGIELVDITASIAGEKKGERMRDEAIAHIYLDKNKKDIGIETNLSNVDLIALLDETLERLKAKGGNG